MNRAHGLAAVAAAAALSGIVSSRAAAEPLGPYIALGAGYDDMPDRKLTIAGRRVSSQWKSGYGGLAALGYRWSPNLRTELEASGRVAKVTTFNGAAPWAGKQFDNSIMVNGFYDVDLGGPLTPYVGVGLGITQLIWADNFRVPTQATPVVFDGDDVELGWQAIIGASYAVSPKVSVALDYRIKGSFADYKFPATVPGLNIDHFKYQTRSVFGSVRYSFGQPGPTSSSATGESVLGPYFAFGLAYDKMPDRNLLIFGRKVDSQWKTGWGALAAIGYRWSPNFRTELEGSERMAKVTTFNDVAPWAGKQWDNSVMLNGLYDVDLGGPVTPYVGVGLGLTELSWGSNFRVPTQALPIVYDSEDTRVGWQLIAGASYAVTPRVSLALDGRLKGAFGGFDFPGSVPGRDITNFKYRTVSVFASVRYAFGEQ
jgi:opacity protein-like surface antigen